MDKNAIKKSAVWARRELISRVSQKAAFYGITDANAGTIGADSVDGRVLTATEKKQRDALIRHIKKNGYEQVMEEVAYTWFNRFSALRYMEVNGYLPTHVRVFTDDSGALKPQILTEAINLELDGLDMQKVYDLKNSNQDEALYRYLLITQCNALNAILPGMFQRIEDYTELLLPDNLLREGSVIEQMVTSIPEEDWTDQVQIIGWLYQYYNAEKKDDVFAALKKNVKITKENIPAATQLFTPDWIVRYMVENSLGRLWVEGHPNDELKANWKYYLDEAEQEPDVQAQLAEIRKEYADLKPEDIRCIDPCMGSGHILVYMFDVLVQIYEAYGYSARDAAKSIVENNLYGLDIDDRAAQLAYFAVMMKARSYDRRFFSRGCKPKVYAIRESNGVDRSALEYFINGDEALKEAMDSILEDMHDAKEYGSIITVRKVDFNAIYKRFDEVFDDISMYREYCLNELLPIVQVAEVISLTYHTVVTNPPYRGISDVSEKLQNYAKSEYPRSKADLSTICMEKALSMCDMNGFVSMINIPVWMFIATYTNLREKIQEENTYVNMLHCGRGIFGSDFGTTAFTIAKRRVPHYEARYHKLFKKQGGVDPLSLKEKWFFERKGEYHVAQEDFSNIEASPLAYWINPNVYPLFSSSSLSKYLESGGRFKTCDDKKYLRFWWEPSQASDNWHFYCKGGDGRKYCGNKIRVLEWTTDSQAFYAANGGMGKKQYWDVEGITWSTISTSVISFRRKDASYFNSSSAPTVFPIKHIDLRILLAYLNSKSAAYLLNMFNPTASLTVADVLKLPYSQEWETDELADIAVQNESDATDDWNCSELSTDFKKHPLVKPYNSLHDAFNAWNEYSADRFKRYKMNEERLNDIFIDVYGLQDELTCDIEDKDVTVRRADLQQDVKTLISYAVGCMFGRYSLNQDGLVYAGGEWDATKYDFFPADKDNIIPISDDEYFEDDIVGRFVKFVEVVYGKDTLDENLKFIADVLGGKGKPKDVIRNYFLNDFYADHCKMYQKSPIYWLFDSGKKGGFKALIYMHRYQPDTIARIRTDYVHEQQGRYRTAISDLESRIANADTGNRLKLTKQLTKLQDQAEELRIYEEKIHHLADQMIRIDLDDGVKHNYETFKDVLAKIK